MKKLLLILLCLSMIRASDYSSLVNKKINISTDKIISSTSQKNILPKKYTLLINELVSINTDTYPDEFNEFDDWVEIHNIGDTAIDLTGLYFSDDFTNPKKYRIPENNIGGTIIYPKSYLVFWFDKNTRQSDYLHVNLKINGSGENLGLFDKTGLPIDTISFAKQYPNISFGRLPEHPREWRYFNRPTPGSTNKGAAFIDVCRKPRFSIVPGFYKNSVKLELISGDTGGNVYYTIDGSSPFPPNGKLYKKPFLIDSNTVVRAVTVKKDYLSYNIVASTYFIATIHSLPVVSLTFHDWEAYYNAGHEITDSEHFGHVEFFENDSMLFQNNIGIKLAGRGSQKHPQKSISLHCREKYKSKTIKSQIFQEKEINRFRGMVLRNSGNGVPKTFFRDALLHTLVSEGTHNDYLAYRPVVTYVNGKYWGIYNLREKKCKHYFKYNHGVNTDSISILTSQEEMEFMLKLHSFFHKKDITIDSAYQYIKQQIDIDNFIDYQITEIYSGNSDWLIGNTRMWKPRLLGAKWRWVLFDVDRAFRWFPTHHNTLKDALGLPKTFSDSSHNRLWDRTHLFRELIKNKVFLHRFLNRFSDLLNTNFREELVLQKIEEFENILMPEMPAHIQRWSKHDQMIAITSPSIKFWKKSVNNMRMFAYERGDTLRKHLTEQFRLDGTVTIEIMVEKIRGGHVSVSSIIPNNYPWEGVYFKNIPIKISAIPEDSYIFKEWVGINEKSDVIELNTKKDISIKAIFVKEK